MKTACGQRAFVREALETILTLETLAKAVFSERCRMAGAHYENRTALRKAVERYRELAESYPFVTPQILKPSAECFTGQADAEGARVISHRWGYR